MADDRPSSLGSRWLVPLAYSLFPISSDTVEAINKACRPGVFSTEAALTTTKGRLSKWLTTSYG